MKYLNMMLLSVLMTVLFISCSSKEDEPTIFSADYYGEFISLTPINTLVVEEYSAKDAIDYMIKNQVPYETSTQIVIEDVPKAERETSKYSVSINDETAHILREIETGQEGMKTQYNVTKYRFKVGSYKIITEETAPFERFIVVSHDKVTIEVWYEGKVTDNIITILVFPNQYSTYSLYDEGVELEPYYNSFNNRSTNHYEEYGKAILNSDGNYTLKFDFSTFSLNPNTGNFIQLSPEYIEIGILDKK